MRRGGGGSDLGGETYLLLVRWRESFKAVEVSLCRGEKKQVKKQTKCSTPPHRHTQGAVSRFTHIHTSQQMFYSGYLLDAMSRK